MSISFPTRIALIALSCMGLFACSTANNATSRLAGIVTPYQIEVVQGNFVSKEQKEALKLGMPRTQVRDLLGSPLLMSVFHADRWDYVFTIRRQGVEVQQRKLVVFFQDDLLTKVEGDPLPSEEEFVSSLVPRRSLGSVPVLEAPADKLPPPAPAASAQASPARSAASGRIYPPLEPAR